MLQHYRMIMLLLSLLPTWAMGQQLPLTGVGTPLSTKTTTCTLPNGYQVHYAFAENQRGPVRKFTHQVLDSKKLVRHQRTLALTGHSAELVSAGFNPQAAIYRFQSIGLADGEGSNDSLTTTVVDTAGQVLSMRRRALDGYRRPAELPLLVTNSSLLLLTSSDYYQTEITLQGLDLQQREQWLLRLKTHATNIRLINFAADDTYAWLLVLENFISRQATSMAYCVELKTGRITAAEAFDTGDEKRIPGIIILKPNHALFVMGDSFRDQRVRWHAEKPFSVTLPAVCADALPATP